MAASQNVRIDVGTSFNGAGLAKAAAGVDQFGKVVKKSSGAIQNIAANVDAMSGAFGKLPGKVGAVVGGIGDFAGVLGTGTMGIGAFVAACGVMGVKLGEVVFGPIREANREFIKWHRNLEDIPKRTHELYDRWRKKWADADRKVDEERRKRQEEEQRRRDQTLKSEAKLLEVKQKIAATERSTGIASLEGEWDSAIAAERDPSERRRLQAQKEKAITEQLGKSRLQAAQDEMDMADRTVGLISRDKGESDQSWNARWKAEELKLELAQAKYAETLEQVTQANARAAEALAAVEEELDEQRRADAQENARRQREIVEEGKRIDAREELSRRIDMVDRQILEAKRRAAESEEVRRGVARGMAADQEAHSGISGGGYHYSTAEDGSIRRFDQFRRARRYAERAARDAASGEIGDNEFNANQERAIRLQGRLNSGKRLSKQDQKWLDDWNDFNKQQGSPKDVCDKLDEVKQTLLETLKVQ